MLKDATSARIASVTWPRSIGIAPPNGFVAGPVAAVRIVPTSSWM